MKKSSKKEKLLQAHKEYVCSEPKTFREYLEKIIYSTKCIIKENKKYLKIIKKEKVCPKGVSIEKLSMSKFNNINELSKIENILFAFDYFEGKE